MSQSSLSHAGELVLNYKNMIEDAKLPYSREIVKFLLQDFTDIQTQVNEKTHPRELRRYKKPELLPILKNLHDDMRRLRIEKISKRNIQVKKQKVRLIRQLLSHIQLHTNTILQSPDISVNYLNADTIKHAKTLLQLEAQKAIQNTEHVGIVSGIRIEDSDAQKAPIVTGVRL